MLHLLNVVLLRLLSVLPRRTLTYMRLLIVIVANTYLVLLWVHSHIKTSLAMWNRNPHHHSHCAGEETDVQGALLSSLRSQLENGHLRTWNYWLTCGTWPCLFMAQLLTCRDWNEGSSGWPPCQATSPVRFIAVSGLYWLSWVLRVQVPCHLHILTARRADYCSGNIVCTCSRVITADLVFSVQMLWSQEQRVIYTQPAW